MTDLLERELDSAESAGEPASAERSPGGIPSGTTIPLPRPKGPSREQPPAFWSERTGKRHEKPKTNDEVVGDGTAGSVGEISRETHPEQTGATRRRGVRASVGATKRGNARGAKGRREMEA